MNVTEPPASLMLVASLTETATAMAAAVRECAVHQAVLRQDDLPHPWRAIHETELGHARDKVLRLSDHLGSLTAAWHAFTECFCAHLAATLDLPELAMPGSPPHVIDAWERPPIPTNLLGAKQ